MKLNYRDRIILGILLAIVIIVAGFFAVINPIIKDIKANKVTLADLERQKEELQKQIDEIPGLKEAITKTYKETNTKIDVFVEPDKIDNARLVDQYMQKFAVDNEVQIQSLVCGDIGTSSVDYYFFRKEFAGEDILTMADLNGERIKEHRDQQAEQEALSHRNIESVLSSTYTINVKGDKENIWKFMTALEEQDKTIIINSVNLGNIEIKEPENPPRYNSPEEEEEHRPTASFNITIYSLYELSEPNLN